VSAHGTIDLVSVVWRESNEVLRRFADAGSVAWLSLPSERRGRWILVENGARAGAGDELASAAADALDDPQQTVLPENRGPAAAYNAAARNVTGAYFALLDTDGAPEADLLVRLALALDADEKAAVAAAAVVPFDAGPAPDAPPEEREWVSAGASLYRTAAFRELGGFDAELFAYTCEEMDFGYRARRAGWRCVLVPQAQFRHGVSHKVTARRERLYREYLMVWRHVHFSRRVTAKAWLAQLPLLAREGRQHGWRAAAGGLLGLFAYFRHIPAAERRRAA
jgi:GT2 family glycosyltransferase